MKLWRTRQTIYPNHLDEVDGFDCLMLVICIAIAVLVAWL